MKQIIFVGRASILIKMNEKGSILAENLEWGVTSLERVCKELGKEEYKWKPTEVSNNIQWQLIHTSRIINDAIPRIITGNMEYPDGLPEDYQEQDHPLDKVMTDIRKGTLVAAKLLKELSNEAFDEEITYWRNRTDVRKNPLFAYIGEVYHHKGQVAYIRGTYKRLKE
jgi:uncharacterized damage-inducible protein DinB